MKKVEIYNINQYYNDSVEDALTTSLLNGKVSLDGTELTININNSIPENYTRISLLYYSRLDIEAKTITIYDLNYYEFLDTDTVEGITSHSYQLYPILSNTISSEIAGYGSVTAQILTSELNPGAIESDTVYGRKALIFPYILDYTDINKNMRSDGLYRFGLIDIPHYDAYVLKQDQVYTKNSLCFGESGTLYKAVIDTINDPEISTDWITATHKDIYNEMFLYQDATATYGLSTLNSVLITKYAKEVCLNNAIQGMWFDTNTMSGLTIAMRIKYLMNLSDYYATIRSDINTLLSLNEIYSVYLAMIKSNRNNPTKS